MVSLTIDEIEEELETYTRLKGESRRVIGRRLYSEGFKLNQKIHKAEKWLSDHFGDNDEERWLKRHDILVTMLKLRDRIEQEVNVEWTA